jgi:uncharacterized membrane protein YfcA
MKFNSKYFTATIGLFLTEVLIALCFNDQFIRPFVGDVLVVILIYCFIRAFLGVPQNKTTKTIGAVFLFACSIECLQYLNLVDRLGLRQNRPMAVIIGTVFDWKDILAYAIGCTIVLWWENSTFRARYTNDDR